MKKVALLLMVALIMALAVSLAVVQALVPKFNIFQEATERVPGEIVRYALTRLDGHSTLEAVFDPPLYALQKHLERPVLIPLTIAKRQGKGQQSFSLPAQQYSPTGRPLAAAAAEVHARGYSLPRYATGGRQWLVTQSTSLSQIMATAQAGDTITLQPGNYELGGVLATKNPGTPEAPIYVRADQPGTVHIRLSSLFYVTQPHWIFENLQLQGNCRASGGPCEHAFHVVGAAKGTVIRNNHLNDFYAHIKVNGVRGTFPDDGLVQFNTFSNAGNYGFSGALAPFDLVGASAWNFADNLVHHFVKAWSPHASYGVFMKGGGSRGSIERNLVVCTGDGDISHHGSRVGISMGGGKTEARFCPDKKCVYEHTDGLIANNIVLNCNDFGIDNNTSVGTVAAHNTLFNTYGVNARGVPSTLLAYGNYLSGHLVAKRGGELDDLQNDTSLNLSGYSNLLAPNLADLVSAKKILTHSAVSVDFCGRPRTSASEAGALISSFPCSEASR